MMFHCNQAKINWYLKRNLADKLRDDPLTIQLKFQPAGPGYKDDLYYLTPKENKCVVCGTDTHLTRHHVIPHCYRKYFPICIKDHSYHDVLLMCIECHDNYENHAGRLKQEIAEEFGVPLTGKGYGLDVNLKKINSWASALIKHGDKIPQARRKEIIEAMRTHFNKNEITEEDLISASEVEYHVKTADFARHGEYVAQNIKDLNVFVQRWRQHFLRTMNPQFMPKLWNIERPIDKIKV